MCMTDTLPISFEQKVPIGDNRERRVCGHCDFVDYTNPKIIAGAVVQKGDKILLCKRAIAPRQHYWTLPAGFMELGETVEEAAKREAHEEAGIDITLDALLATYSVPRIGQVHLMYAATLTGDFAAGPESEAVALFDWSEIPWRHLAFPTVAWALSHYATYRLHPQRAPFTNPPNTSGLTHPA